MSVRMDLLIAAFDGTLRIRNGLTGEMFGGATRAQRRLQQSAATKASASSTSPVANKSPSCEGTAITSTQWPGVRTNRAWPPARATSRWSAAPTRLAQSTGFP